VTNGFQQLIAGLEAVWPAIGCIYPGKSSAFAAPIAPANVTDVTVAQARRFNRKLQRIIFSPQPQAIHLKAAGG
jgi:hypothetical protein